MNGTATSALSPGASRGSGSVGMYEPVHGSAPDIAGQGIANPLATILSAAMMLRYSLGCGDIAARIEAAVSRALERGARTKDIALKDEKVLSTPEMGDRVLAVLEESL